jgi:hypothetical protein
MPLDAKVRSTQVEHVKRAVSKKMIGLGVLARSLIGGRKESWRVRQSAPAPVPPVRLRRVDLISASRLAVALYCCWYRRSVGANKRLAFTL